MRVRLLVVVTVGLLGAACGSSSRRSEGPFLLAASIIEMPPNLPAAETGAGPIPAVDARQARARLFLGDAGNLASAGAPPTPVRSADVTVRWTKDGTVSPPVPLALFGVGEQGDLAPWAAGDQYVADSIRTGLEYVEGARYEFTVRYEEHTFTAIAVAPPRALARLAGPLAGGVTTLTSRTSIPMDLERSCTEPCPPAFVAVFPGGVSWLDGGTVSAFVSSAPTCGSFPGTAAALAASLPSALSTAVLPLPGPECFDRVLSIGPYDELFLPSIIVVERGTVSPHPLLVAESVAIAGVSDSVTIRLAEAYPP